MIATFALPSKSNSTSQKTGSIAGSQRMAYAEHSIIDNVIDEHSMRGKDIIGILELEPGGASTNFRCCRQTESEQV